MLCWDLNSWVSLVYRILSLHRLTLLSLTVNLPEPGIYSVVDDSKAVSPQTKQLRSQVIHKIMALIFMNQQHNGIWCSFSDRKIKAAIGKTWNC